MYETLKTFESFGDAINLSGFDFGHSYSMIRTVRLLSCTPLWTGKVFPDQGYLVKARSLGMMAWKDDGQIHG